MTRREALNHVAWLMGGTIIGTQFLISGCQAANTTIARLFEEENLALFNEIAEVIIPKTSTPGAKEANVGLFMAKAIRDCYTSINQEIFTTGLTLFKNTVKQKYSTEFLSLNQQQRIEVITQIDREMQKYSIQKTPDAPYHYYHMMKELTLLGYFTSEAGCTKALRYVPVPGKYDGSYPYRKGDKAWALS
jgi:hypothetical protein